MEHQLAHGPYQEPQTTTGRVEEAFRIGLQITVAPASTYRSRIPRIHGLAGFSRVRLPYASQTQVGRIGRGTLQEASNPHTAPPITVR
jgi:hypothetical protein